MALAMQPMMTELPSWFITVASAVSVGALEPIAENTCHKLGYKPKAYYLRWTIRQAAL
jgi:hypothetical protein